MTLPTKENPSNSVRYSARSPRRMAMQYITKPEARTMLIRPVRMEMKVPSRPGFIRPMKLSARFSTSTRARYRQVIPRGLTWAERSSSFISCFRCFRSISCAIIICLGLQII